MTDLNELKIYISRQSNGLWLAATGNAPYFCFEGVSEAAVLEAAKGALQFYKRVLDANGGELPAGNRLVPSQAAPEQFKVDRTVSAGELIAA